MNKKRNEKEEESRFKVSFKVDVDLTPRPESVFRSMVDGWEDMDEHAQDSFREFVGGEIAIIKYPQLVNVTIENVTEPTTAGRTERSRFRYAVENLPNEFRAIVRQVCIAEFFAAEFHDLVDGDGTTVRDDAIRDILNATDKRLRIRLRKANGRPKAKHDSKYETERSDFLAKCIFSLALLDSTGKKLSKTNLSKRIYPPDQSKLIEHPEKALGYKLKKFDFTMSELIDIYRRNDNIWKEVMSKIRTGDQSAHSLLF